MSSSNLSPSQRRHGANAIRALSMDAVQKAASGHPGMPMGMADIAQVLWCDYLRHNPANPQWFNRDRFVLSNGHGSMLLYALLHLSGYDLPMSELANFRQLHSKTPGHPENGLTPGVETTTGPLGQGLANAVGMAIAETVLSARFNESGHELIDHNTYAFVGDGCLMEGISHEVCSLAGTLGLGKLIVFWDDNGISIDGPVDGWFTDDTAQRFQAYGWQVLAAVDGHDAAAIKAAIDEAHKDTSRPTLIACKTVIGFGSPNKSGKASSHGAPLGDEEIALTRAALDWQHPPFEIPTQAYDVFDAKEQGASIEANWQTTLEQYRASHVQKAADLERLMSGQLPATWSENIQSVMQTAVDEARNDATRKASQWVLESLVEKVPELFGGSADLTGSNNTRVKASVTYDRHHRDGNYLYYGVREFGMAAVMNGMCLHGGVIPYGGTFLMFSEYARNALRMAALMKIGTIFVFTHDSIGLGEDGPTHQAVEQAATLRLMPNMSLWRPADMVESTVAWKMAVERRDGPTSLLFTRQTLAHQSRDAQGLMDISRGGYILVEPEGSGPPGAIVIATGSEVELARRAVTKLNDEGHRVRLVSMPCTDVFDAQDAQYREQILPRAVSARVAVEAGVTDGWWKYVGIDGEIIGIDRFGESAPAAQVFEYLGLTDQAVVDAVERVLS